MKPSFALNISDTAIGLLHRTARGWLQVGETTFDTADLAEALGYLRGSALGLSPGGLTTKLVLPNSQIKYLELDAPGPNDTDRRNQIRAGLVGRTPYNVEDLVFDWSGTGARVHVAVVARETLDEAEAFAAEHRFNPVSFVGLPLKGDFKGEPWFGPTKLSATVLEKGEKVERDNEPVQIAARDLPKSHPGAGKSTPASSDRKSDTASKALPDKEKTENPVIDAADAPPPAPIAVEAPEVAVAQSPAAASWPVNRAQTTAQVPTDGGDGVKTAAFEKILPGGASQLADTADVAIPAVTGAQAFPEIEAAVSDAGGLPKDDLPPAPPAAIMAAFASRRAGELTGTKPVGSAIAAEARDTMAQSAAQSVPPPLSRPIVGADTAAVRSDLRQDSVKPRDDVPLVRPTLGKSNTAFVTAPTIPGSRKRKSVPADAQNTTQPGGPEARKSLTKPGGTFASSKQRGKPRYLGLILTGLLLVFLALIAAWSSFVTSSNDVPDPGAVVASAPADADPAAADPAAADVPAVDDEMLADAQDPAEFDAESLAAADALVDPAADLDVTATVQPDAVVPESDAAIAALEAPAAEPETAPVAALPEPAPVGIVVTDVPNAAPLNEAQDEIFLATMDAPPLALDPLALPQPVASTDALPLPQLEPPPFGTVYQFDADGLIRPTPEGIVTPAGVRLVAGKPTPVPPARPDALVATALPAATATAIENAVTALIPGAASPASQPFPSDPALADARPRPRPAGLAPPAAQSDDDAALTAPGATRISSLRPLPRPATVLAAGEAARQSTAAASLTAQAEQAAAVEDAVLAASFQPDANTSPLAVRVSRKPAARPKDMSRAVEAAVAAAVRAPEPTIADAQPEADDEPETASAAPAIPTRASVAKQATYVNAINLSKINLIGVYGTKSSRYALIRQSNGRYKKVRVGDSIDGGKVAAINSDEVRYQKSGRMVSLKLPRT